MNTNGVRLVLLSGTPIINHPFELSFMLNLIRGTMKIHELQFLKGSRIPNIKDIQQMFPDFDKYIDQINILEGKNTLQISLLPNGFINIDDSGSNSTNINVKRFEWSFSESEIINEIIKILKTHRKSNNFKIGKRVALIEKFALPEEKKTLMNYS
jgi:hypothetical protein